MEINKKDLVYSTRYEGGNNATLRPVQTIYRGQVKVWGLDAQLELVTGSTLIDGEYYVFESSGDSRTIPAFTYPQDYTTLTDSIAYGPIMQTTGGTVYGAMDASGVTQYLDRHMIFRATGNTLELVGFPGEYLSKSYHDEYKKHVVTGSTGVQISLEVPTGATDRFVSYYDSTDQVRYFLGYAVASGGATLISWVNVDACPDYYFTDLYRIV